MSALPVAGRLVLLLRGINVGGHRKLPMAELRAICAEVGLSDVRTYVASGNVVATSHLPPERAAAALECAIEARFGFRADVIARPAKCWGAYLDDNPFASQSVAEPNRVMLLLAKRGPEKGAAEVLGGLADESELVTLVRDGLWIYFSAAVARSRLTPVNIDKAMGAPTTARNWRTVQALAQLATG
jgi:uncharacterized protein (DUF1697 family)